MLDKIINIKAALHYQKEKSSSNNFERLLYGTVKEKLGVKDSIRFSPAAHFLGRISWHLKDLVFEGNDKLIIAFSADGFDFHTEIDFLNFHLKSRQFYEIAACRLVQGKAVSAQLRISAAKGNRTSFDEKPGRKFQGLEELFNRVYSLELSGEIDKYYSSALHELMDAIKENLIGEFDYIYAALFTLIDKICPGRLMPNYAFPEDRNEPLIIERIKVIND